MKNLCFKNKSFKQGFFEHFFLLIIFKFPELQEFGAGIFIDG